MVPALLATGMSPQLSRLFQELTHGINSGRVAWEGGHPISEAFKRRPWRHEENTQHFMPSTHSSRSFRRGLRGSLTGSISST